MQLYHCLLTLHDNVFFATREMGILYETEKYLHNWALSFAFFKDAYLPTCYQSYGQSAQTPTYLESNVEGSLLPLNQAGIYVFPAQPLRWHYQINTFKAAQVSYYGQSKQFGAKGANRNYPINYGRAKELGIGSQYRTYIAIADKPNFKIPRWIRLGKWSAKVEVRATAIPSSLVRSRSGEYICQHPLNPIDLSPNTQLLLYNRIVMPPVSLIAQSQLRGDYWQVSGDEWQTWKQQNSQESQLPNTICLPQSVEYGASYVAAVS
jgi:CRISPR-associated protein Csc1